MPVAGREARQSDLARTIKTLGQASLSAGCGTIIQVVRVAHWDRLVSKCCCGVTRFAQGSAGSSPSLGSSIPPHSWCILFNTSSGLLSLLAAAYDMSINGRTSVCLSSLPLIENTVLARQDLLQLCYEVLSRRRKNLDDFATPVISIGPMLAV